ncbi:tetratricopeptide repeat protein [Marinitoga piezophila KA3]|uniref:Tetratricopeptide repeat protein n=1 Tax=Marinitoga piezophila (strain DSM 14283 / JCM 11233 / KA3) TaxID=443254 RepID=H2J498_MARPK|nr:MULTISPECIES: tetratricopeptide repeat protein [Marinitoga]AEX85913.1 tetratricopeptide repeat protein [Marinitoga piezophila KA3]
MKNYKYAIVYLDLKPEYAKLYNLPVKLPVLVEDMKKVANKNKLPLDVILRGLEAQYEISKDEYYKSYLVYFYYEAFKEALNKDDFEQANYYLNAAKKLGGEDYRFNFYRALLLKKSEQEELAELELKEALVKNPNFHLGHFELGNLMFERKLYDEALEAYKNALELNPEFLLPKLKIADVYIENGLFSEAIQELNELLEKDPGFVAAYVRLGILFNQLQRYEDAALIQEKGLKIDSENVELLYNLGFTYARLGKHLKAVEVLKKAAEISETDYILHELAIAYRNIGEYIKSYDTAKKAYNVAKKENKNLIALFLIKILSIIGNYEDIEKYYNELKDTEFMVSAKTFLMFAYISEGEIEKAKQLANELNNYGLYGNMVSILDKVEKYVDYLESIADEKYTIPLINSFDEEGFIDKLGLYENLKKNNIEIESLLNDEINEEISGLELITNALLLSGIDYGLGERVATLLARYLWKDGKGLFITRFLLRIYQDKVFGNFSTLDVFISDIIEEMKDLHFGLSRLLADYELNLIDFDGLIEYNLSEFEDIIKVIISYMHIKPLKSEIENEEFEDSKVQSLLLWLANLDELIKI